MGGQNVGPNGKCIGHNKKEWQRFMGLDNHRSMVVYIVELGIVVWVQPFQA